MTQHKPVVLVVLDGWGETKEVKGNAIRNAKNLTTFYELDRYYPKSLLQASGISVGLPWLQYGNSEVGHQTLGTGQVSFQDLPRISNAIKNGSFFKNETILEVMKSVKNNKSRLHLMGLVSDGGIHAHIDHLLAFMEMAKAEGIGNQTRIHAITDGRDAPPTSAVDYIKKIADARVGQIATVSGRYYAMDRNNNWDRTQKAFDAIVNGIGINDQDPLIGIKKQYDQSVTDEYIKPIVITDNKGEPKGKIQENDAIIFFNFRKDRAKQIAYSFLKSDFDKFLANKPNNYRFVCMIEYEKGLAKNIAYPPQAIKQRLSEIISAQGMKQLKIAETEKYAHVTYFFNGGVEIPYENEDQILVPSKNASSYDQAPEMSAKEITEKLLQEIDKETHDFILVNYANPDMVGHSGNYEAGVRAIESLNIHMKELIIKILQKNGCLLITADHGNAEEMINLKTGEKDTQHSNNPVPCWLVNKESRRTSPLQTHPEFNIQGMLVDVAPTILSILGINKQGLIGMDLRKIMK